MWSKQAVRPFVFDMKAIVLSCDRYRRLTEHMVLKYAQVWPDHPFRFRIPYQELSSEDDSLCEYVQCPVAIKATVLELLKDLDDEEWVYWCIDDKYPVRFDLKRMRPMVSSLEDSSDMSGVLFCRCRHLRKGKSLTGDHVEDNGGNVYLQRSDYRQIWLHQFLRVKVLRNFFCQMPDAVTGAKEMDRIKSCFKLPESDRLFVTRRNMCVFGESTARGRITGNCYQSMTDNDMRVPENMTVDEDLNIVIGENGFVSAARRLLGISPSW